MNQRIKDALGVAVLVAVLALGYAAVQYVGVYASSIQPGSYRSFSASGEGKVVVVPDVAQVSFSVLTEGGKDLGTLQTKNTEKVNTAIDFVKAKGVDSKDIKTESYNISPRYQSYNCNPRPLLFPYDGSEPQACPPAEIVGYTIHQSVSVKIRDFAKIGEILTGVVSAGANSVNGPSFVLDDPTKAQNEARAEAIRKAQESAEAIARAGGFRLGQLLAINEGGVYPMYMKEAYGRGGAMALDAAVAPAPSIEPGSTDVAVTVTLQYEIR